MTSIVNLFSNFDDLTKKKTVTDSASTYAKYKYNSRIPTPALTQGERFKRYQKKIKNSLVKNAIQLSGKEGFTNVLTEQSEEIIKNNNYSSQQQTITNLQTQYNTTLTQYENLLAEISGSVTGYINRVDSSNPYLGKNIQFTSGETCYVTNQGVAKLYPSAAILTSTSGLNGCPASSQVLSVSLPWLPAYNSPGVTIPTTPSLITGTPMTAGQSCGNEGTNVYVDQILNNPSATYQGCYADNTASPLMTFIGGAPQPPSGNLQNGTFNQPQIANNSYQYISSNSTVVGWDFYAVLINNSTAWGYPMPYPSGNQAACIQATQIIGQWINLNSGTYTITFYACGRPGYSGANTINIYCGQTGTPQSMPTVYSFTPPTTAWQQYTTTLNISSSGNYALGFYGTIDNNNNSTAIQNIVLSTSGSSSSNGTYTYEMCQQAAIDNEYQYFALQNVNPTTATGYCAVSNDEPSSTSLGPGLIPSGKTPLWSSKTSSSKSSNPGSTAALAITGSLTVYNTGGQAVFSTPAVSSIPAGYVGCYTDNSNRAMSATVLSNNTIGNPNGPYNWGMNTATCQQTATNNNYQYYGIQAGSVCFLSNDLSQTTQYGKASNCSGSGNNIVGGGWANAVYSAGTPPSNYYLILQDDGNMCIYRGTSPSDNQGLIWAAGTNGKTQQPNPVYAAANGAYGQNWISSGSTLASGDFVGSTNGNMALIMQGDGNLVLYTFTNASNCQQMSDGNTGGGVGANALYNIGEVGVQSNMGKLAYIDQNSELHTYPSTNTQFTNSYTELTGTDSPGNDISGASYGNATVEDCQNTCNNSATCGGFSFSNATNTCYPKTSAMYPNGQSQPNANVDLYMRNPIPLNPPIGVPNTTNNTDSITFQNYVNGGTLSASYGLSNATSAQQQQLAQLQTQLDSLTSQMNTYTNKFGQGSQTAASQMNANVAGVKNYLTDLTQTREQITETSSGMNGVDNILQDSDIIVLQKNYDYLFWSILAAGSVLVAMNIVKK